MTFVTSFLEGQDRAVMETIQGRIVPILTGVLFDAILDESHLPVLRLFFSCFFALH